MALYSSSTLHTKAPEVLTRLSSYDHLTSPRERKLRLGHGLEDFLLARDRPAGLVLCPEITVLPPLPGGYVGARPRARIICPNLALTKFQSTYPGGGSYENTDL